ncbi:MAG TPA: flagellar basal-body MS-ring/collar protein FliF [Terracidiphilus sp.]|nr:flagellar basal-body MS-ring/collar protein FliF [Terracidiphilus sp.]
METTPTQLEKIPAMKPAGLAAQASALWTRARVRWAGMQPGQQRWAVISAALLAALLSGLIWYAVRTDWRTLYAGMDPEEARQTGIVLTQAQISFEVAENGTALLVPAAQLDKARLATAAKGAVKSGRMGFELFDKPNWVGSEFDERVNYQRALEGELEHTIGTLSDVESARVNLVLPHDSLFRDEERPAKASVVLKLRHGGLAEGEPDAIRNLVASAVDGLTPDRVVLVDAAGHLPLGPKTPEALHLSAEQALEQKIIATLEPVTGPGNVRASVTLDYDEAATDQTDETYDPTKSAPLTMQRTQQTSGGQPVAAGVPGAASNAPNTNAQQLPVYPKQTTPPETSSSESGTYGVSKVVRHSVQSPGAVRRMTAAIVVNDRLLRPAAKGQAAQWQPWSADQLHNLTALAQASVGYDAARGDVLTVQDLAFDANRPAPPPPIAGRVLSAMESSPELLKYGALLAGLLLVLALGVRPALARVHGAPQKTARKSGVKEAAALAEGAAQPMLEPPVPPAPDPARIRAQEIFEQVTTHLKHEPTQSSRLLQSWIHSD